MVKPFIAHYRNKYPGGYVDSDGACYLRAYDAKGRLRVVLCAAAGSLQDRSKIAGAMDVHCGAPIPKDTRVWCDMPESVEKHREADARMKVAAMVAEQYDGRVPSVQEICQEDFQNSVKFVDAFSAESYLSESSEPAKPLRKKKAAVKK